MNALFIAVKTLAGIVYPGAESRKWDPEFWPRPTWSAHTVLQPFTKGICFIWQIRARLSIFDIEASQYEPQHWPFACLASWQLWSGAKLLKKNAFFFFVQINATAALMNPQMLQKHPKLRYQEMPLQTGSITWPRTTPMMVLLEVSVNKCVSHVIQTCLTSLARLQWHLVMHIFGECCSKV